MLSEIKKIVKHGLACAQRYGASAGLHLMARLELAHHAKGLSSVEIPGLKNPIWLRPRTSDAETLIQVFALAEYDVFGTRQYAWLSNRYEEIVSGGGRPLIIDCGANIGLSAIWFSSRYPKAEIVAVEPHDGNLAIMRRNLAHYPNVRIVQGGVWDASCRLSVINPDAQPWAYITEQGESGGIAAYTVDELSEERPIFMRRSTSKDRNKPYSAQTTRGLAERIWSSSNFMIGSSPDAEQAPTFSSGSPGRTLNSSVLPKTCSFSCIGSAVSARWRPPC